MTASVAIPVEERSVHVPHRRRQMIMFNKTASMISLSRRQVLQNLTGYDQRSRYRREALRTGGKRRRKLQNMTIFCNFRNFEVTFC